MTAHQVEILVLAIAMLLLLVVGVLFSGNFRRFK